MITSAVQYKNRSTFNILEKNIAVSRYFKAYFMILFSFIDTESFNSTNLMTMKLNAVLTFVL